MIDPISVGTALTGLITAATKTVLNCNSLATSLRNAPSDLSAISTECSAIKSGLYFIYGVIKFDSNVLAAGLMVGSPLAESFDVTLTACAVTFARLDNALQHLIRSAGNSRWRDRMRFVWHENTMKSLLEQMRGLRSAVNTIMDNLNTMLELLTAKEPVMESVRRTLLSPTKPDTNAETMSIFSHAVDDKQFAFDDEVFNSAVYRRVLQQMRDQDSSRISAERTSQTDYTSTTDPDELLIVLDDPSDNAPDNPNLMLIGTRTSAKDDLLELLDYNPGGLPDVDVTPIKRSGTSPITDKTSKCTPAPLLSAIVTRPAEPKSTAVSSNCDLGTGQLPDFSPDDEPGLPGRPAPIIPEKADLGRSATVASTEPPLSPTLPYRTNTGFASIGSIRTLPPRYTFVVEQPTTDSKRRRSSQVEPSPRRESTHFEQNLNLAGGGVWMTFLKDVTPSSFSFRGVGSSNTSTSIRKTFLTIPLIGDSGTQIKSAVKRWAQARVSPSCKFSNDALSLDGAAGDGESYVPLHLNMTYYSQRHLDRLLKIPPGEAPFALVCFSIMDLNSLENVSKKWVDLTRRYASNMRILLLGLGPSAGLIRPGSLEPDHVDYDAVTGIPDFQGFRLRTSGFVSCASRRLGVQVARHVGADAYFECSELSIGDLHRVFVTLLGVAAAVRVGSETSPVHR